MCGRIAAAGRLRDHGSRVFALTDNTLELSGRQLEEAGEIDPLVSGRHAPSDPVGICLIGSHAWDTLGAVRAGRPRSFFTQARTVD
jgi:2-haloacid dehalogenase